MPELPEVETVRRALESLALHRKAVEYVVLRLDYIRRGAEHAGLITGGVIETIERRGKFLALHLSNGFVLVHHLGMSGRLLLSRSSEPLAPHTHVRILLDNGVDELRQTDPRRFGFAAIVRENELGEYASWAQLGPDPLVIQSTELARRLHGRTQPIKNALLNQRILAGVGNIYADEALFRACIHPLRPAGQLSRSDVARLLRALRRVLRESIASGGSSTSDFRQLDGTFGEFQHNHRVYGREGEPCWKCRAPIRRIVLSGRSAHFCEQCQIDLALERPIHE